MNLRLVFNQLGLLFVVLSLLLLLMAGGFFGLSVIVGFHVDPEARLAFIITGGVGLLVSGTLWLATRHGHPRIGRREALLLVALSWLLGAAFSAMPYFLWAKLEASNADMATDHPFNSFVACYFEAMSGLTTTGATVLGTNSTIETIPESLLLWRAITHWIGGLGIVVLFVAVLPSLGVGGKRLYRLEAPGPTKDRFHPQVRETARILWRIYLGLTIAEIILLKIAGMSWFDSICHTFATLATGGFSPKDASVGHYDSTAINIIITIFMVFGGLNFALLYQLIRRRFRAVFSDPELRLYLMMLLGGMSLVAWSLFNARAPIFMTTGQEVIPTAGRVIIESAFTTVAIQTTTGFCTSDFNQWPFLAKAVLVFLMFVGGCAGSTGGGIKVIRLWIVMKILWGELERVFRPQVVRPVKVARTAVEPEMKLSILAYVLGFILLFTAGALAVQLIEGESATFTTSATASIACLATIGPGLDQVGAVANYGWLSAPSQFLLSMLMVIGRLEVFAILVLFSPRFWKTD